MLFKFRNLKFWIDWKIKLENAAKKYATLSLTAACRTLPQVRQYSDESLGLFFGNRCLSYYDTEGKIIEPTLELQKVA